MQKTKRLSKLKQQLPIIVPVSVLVMLVISYFVFPAFKDGVNEAFEVLTSDDSERVQAWVNQFGMLGPLVIILAMAVQMFLFVIPNVLLMMIAIICYGPIWGSVIAFCGVFISSSLGYFIGRKLNRVTLDKFVSEQTQKKIADFITHYGVGAIAITRLSSFSNDALSFVAGILEMSYKRYILATLGGITPLIILLAIYGKNGKIEKALIWIGSISLILLIAYIIIDKRRKKNKSRQK